MEIELYRHKANGEFTSICAQVEEGELTLSEHDMGEFEREYSRDGEVESFVYFDNANTRKLMRTLGMKGNGALLDVLKRRFKKYEASMKCEICYFCDEHAIKYTTQVYY